MWIILTALVDSSSIHSSNDMKGSSGEKGNQICELRKNHKNPKKIRRKRINLFCDIKDFQLEWRNLFLRLYLKRINSEFSSKEKNRMFEEIRRKLKWTSLIARKEMRQMCPQNESRNWIKIHKQYRRFLSLIWFFRQTSSNLYLNPSRFHLIST